MMIFLSVLPHQLLGMNNLESNEFKLLFQFPRSLEKEIEKEKENGIYKYIYIYKYKYIYI